MQHGFLFLRARESFCANDSLYAIQTSLGCDAILVARIRTASGLPRWRGMPTAPNRVTVADPLNGACRQQRGMLPLQPGTWEGRGNASPYSSASETCRRRISVIQTASATGVNAAKPEIREFQQTPAWMCVGCCINAVTTLHSCNFEREKSQHLVHAWTECSPAFAVWSTPDQANQLGLPAWATRS